SDRDQASQDDGFRPFADVLPMSAFGGEGDYVCARGAFPFLTRCRHSPSCGSLVRWPTFAISRLMNTDIGAQCVARRTLAGWLSATRLKLNKLWRATSICFGRTAR